MNRATVDFTTIDLDNCHQEPIHVPGYIQPHGVLIAFDLEGGLTHASQNARFVLPGLPALGDKLSQWLTLADLPLRDALAAALSDARSGQESDPLITELQAAGAWYDVVMHLHDGLVIAEFERREGPVDELANFALLAHRSMGHLRNRKDIANLMSEAVGAVRRLTGFDRVMAYRFHHDDSGEVVTEEREPHLEPFLHRRFPASDIPVQARALYVLNPLRLIADVNDRQIPIEADHPSRKPLDLSYSVLRSVSPIHIEYLKNIQVAASMSLSIVVHGRLWGLIACHHGSGYRVPYAVRMTCDVLSHVLSSAVQSAVERLATKRRQAAEAIRKDLAAMLLETDNFAFGFAAQTEALREVVSFDATLCTYAGTRASSALSTEAGTLLLRWLDAGDDNLVAIHESSRFPEPLRMSLQPFCGLLAICIDRVHRGWIVLMRKEQVHTIVWSGIPAKLERIGPLGARLTPQGSLAEWRQTVEGTCVAWDDGDRSIALDLMEALSRAGAAQAARMEMARAQLLAVLGHDLRDPLQTIGMMGTLLERGAPDRSAVYGKRITDAIGRMQRLIGEVFEMSRMGAGLGLGMSIVAGDLAILVRALVEDARLTHPETSIRLDAPSSLSADFDADRIAQVVNNLLSNARNHGVIGESIWLSLANVGHSVVLRVANMAPPIAPDDVDTLFDPFKPRSIGNVRNPGGLGLGLYIASEVAKGHGGTLGYSHDGARVTFTVLLPRRVHKNDQIEVRAADFSSIPQRDKSHAGSALS